MPSSVKIQKRTDRICNVIAIRNCSFSLVHVSGTHTMFSKQPVFENRVETWLIATGFSLRGTVPECLGLG